ncbi:MAG: twin-arginine translocation signal domain-containing protein, partial [Pseudomonadota bacterium]
MPSRRSFLRAGLAAGASTAIFPAAMPAFAQSAQPGEYRALVAVWALGGMDGFDAMLPLDEQTHAQFKAWRP